MTDKAIHPGRFLAAELKARGITQAKLAAHIHVSPAYVNDIVRGRRGVSTLMSMKLQQALGLDAFALRRMQNSHDLSQIIDELEELNKIAPLGQP